MLHKRLKDKPDDPEDIMTGKCATCGYEVELERWQAQKPAMDNPLGNEPGIWSDLYSCECPNCKKNCVRTIGEKVGTRIYLMQKRK